MALKKKDFIEIEFTGKIKESGEIFDSNIKEDLKKINSQINPKPFIFALGEEMFLKGIDEFLIGKSDKPAEYTIELSPENAFGPRNSKLIQMIPIKFFKQHNVNPIPGIMLNLDGRPAKVLSVSGGRVLVDLNNPLAGKDVIYKIKILRKIEDINEKIKATSDFLFRRDLEFKVQGNKVLFEVEKNLVKFIELFKDKFKEILNLELEVKEIAEKVKEKVEKLSN